MKTVSQYLDEKVGPSDCQQQLPDGRWVNATPLPFYYGPLAKEYWVQIWENIKDSWLVLIGTAEAVEKK